MYNQMSIERGVTCKTSVDVMGIIVCQPEQLHATIDKVSVSGIWQFRGRSLLLCMFPI